MTCEVCHQKNEATWKCLPCGRNMCDDCKTVHLQNRSTRDHGMTRLDAKQPDELLLCTTKGNVSYCGIHKSEVSQIYCYQCFRAVCLECLSNYHEDHDVVLISNEIDSKKTELREIIHKSKSKLSAYRSEVISLKNKIDNFSEQTEIVAESVKKHGEILKMKIDEIVQDVLSDLENEEKKKKSHLRQIQTQLETETIDLTVFVAKCEKKLKSSNHVSVITAVTKINRRPEIEEPITSVPDVQPPGFVPTQIDLKKLRNLLGKLKGDKTLDVETEAGRSSCEAQVRAERPQSPCLSLFTSFPSPSPSTDCIATLNNRLAFVGWRWIGREIFLISIRGKVKCRVNLDFTLGDLSASSDGKLYFTVGGSHFVKKLVDQTTCIDIKDTAPFITRGLHVTRDNEILVCLYNLNSKQGKVSRMSLKGEQVQEIQHDESENPLFIYPQDVFQNYNGDVCVIDRIAPSVNKHELVVVDKDGRFRFRYPCSKTSRASGFVCTGITCDKNGNIFLSDRENNRIHLIDKDGNFIKYILSENEGIKSPTGLSMDKNRQLWICNDYKSVLVGKLE